jgi:hypothetical protein
MTRCEAAAPGHAAQPVTELLLTGVDAIRAQVKPADEFAVDARLGGPVAQQRGLRIERKPARQDLPYVPFARRREAEADVAHDFRVGIELDQPIDVTWHEAPQPQALGL